MEWSTAATDDWNALAQAQDAQGTLWALDAVLALAQKTVPGRSLLGRVLRDPTIWPEFQNILRSAVDPNHSIHSVRNGFSLGAIEFEAEDIARAERSRQVCERHLAGALSKRGQSAYGNLILQIDRVAAAVRDLELGPGFQVEHIQGRWHGLIDTSIVIEYTDIWSIDWPRLTEADAVTIWVSPVLLGELDQQKYFHRNPRVMRRARVFTRWLQDKLDQAITADGFEIHDGVILRAWAPTLELFTPDSGHLEAAFALLDRQVPIHLVTGDIEQRLRATAHQIPVFTLPESCLLDNLRTERDAEG